MGNIYHVNLCSLFTCPRQTLLINHDTPLVRILLAERDQLKQKGIYCTDSRVVQKAREGAAGSREVPVSPLHFSSRCLNVC